VLLLAGPGGRAPAADATGAPDLPIRAPALDGMSERSPRVLNLYSQEMLLDCVSDGGADGLNLDLARQPLLLDGARIDFLKIAGTAWIAPYPVGDPGSRGEAAQFRRGAVIREGRAELKLSDLDNGPGWKERGQILVRLEISLVESGLDRDLGTYEFLAGFRRDGKTYRRAVTVSEGPYVAGVASDDPERAVLRLRVEPPAGVSVLVHDGYPPKGEPRRIESPATGLHEIVIAGLLPDHVHSYAIECDGWTCGPFPLRTAPLPGEGTVRFAFAGDSRQGPGGGARAFMGVNAHALGLLLRDARERDVRFWIHGGDLVSGYTGSVEDFRAQLRAFQWTAAAFLHERPMYNLMGNHDCVIRAFEAGGHDLVLDRWPYATESSEAVFASEFTHPANGPVPDDPRRPPYAETVYSFSFGPARVIALNNNYWVSTRPETHGGSPEGCVLADQLRWLRSELDRAEQDPAVRHLFLVMQEPPFPNSAHLDDGMWYEGDAGVRGQSVPAGSDRPQPEPMSVIETRNEIVRLAAATTKAVALLASDEHNYSRMLLTPETPAGEPPQDDRTGDGKLDAPLSPLRGLRRPLWCIISGGGGAPHYPEADSPWNRWWKTRAESCPDPAGCYRFSMLNHWVLLEASGDRVSLEARAITGEVIDRVADLRAALR
jgi:hypothetical protein